MSEWKFAEASIIKNIATIQMVGPASPMLIPMQLEEAVKLVIDLNMQLTKAGKPVLPLAELDSTNHFRTPVAVRAEGVTMPGIEGPARILLSLEDGSQLAIPVTQHTIDALYRSLRSMTTQP